MARTAIKAGTWVAVAARMVNRLVATEATWCGECGGTLGAQAPPVHRTTPSGATEGGAAQRMCRALSAGYRPRPGNPHPSVSWGAMWGAARLAPVVHTLRSVTTQGAARESRAVPSPSAYDDGREARQIMMTLRSLRGEEKWAYFETVVRQNKANVFHCNAMLASCASPQQARDFMARMRSLGIAPDVVSYTSLMQLETKSAGGRLGAAEALLEEMKKCEPSVVPNVRTHMVLIEGHGKRGRLEDAVAAWQRMLAQGVAANEYVYTALIDACAKRMDAQSADRILHAALNDGNIKPNVQMFTAMIDMNARAGRASKVKALWVSTPDNCC